MKQLLIILLLIYTVAATAQTQKTRAQLNTTVNTYLPDNNTKAITPATLRSVLKDIYFSSYNLIDDAAGVEVDPKYKIDSSFIKTGVRSWNGSLAKNIDGLDTAWWGRAETDPKYTADSSFIKSALRSLAEGNKYIYSIILPYSTTVAGRIAATVEGSDYPEGWELSADGLNLVVTHNLGRWVANVTVFANIINPNIPMQRQQLFNTAAYNGVTCLNSNELKILSLSKIATSITVYLIFE